jgi:N-acetylglucosamine-6-phosphate deacetylase
VHVDGNHYATGRPIRIDIEGGIIRDVHEMGGGGDLPVVAPGLIDLQINGYAGLDFNGVPMPPETLGKAVRLLWREGVTSFCPTVITNSDEAISEGMVALARSCEEDRVVDAAVVGVHLEGPFISPEDGPRGAHAREHVRPPDFEAFRRWQEAAGGRIRILTMSPEWPESAEFIEQCRAVGVNVSIGHTAASPQQIRQAVCAGARLSTHLGNGAHLMLPRHPNYIWEQLAQDDLWTTLIADGFHLPEQVLKVVMKVKGARAMLVSDAVSLCGMPPGEYTMPVGGRVVLTQEGKLHLAENEKLLAGSAQPLLRGVEHLITSDLADFAEAWEMASIRPATFLALPQSGGLAQGAPADLLLLSREGGDIRVVQTYKSGVPVAALSEVR